MEKLFDSNARACNDGCLLLNRVAPDFGVVGLWESNVGVGEQRSKMRSSAFSSNCYSDPKSVRFLGVISEPCFGAIRNWQQTGLSELSGFVRSAYTLKTVLSMTVGTPTASKKLHEWIRSEVIESGHGSLDEGHWPTVTERQRCGGDRSSWFQAASYPILAA